MFELFRKSIGKDLYSASGRTGMPKHTHKRRNAHKDLDKLTRNNCQTQCPGGFRDAIILGEFGQFGLHIL